MANARIREALTAGNNTKEKGPQQADGILSVTPDSPDAAEWRSKCLLDCAGTSSTFLDDDEDGPKPHDLYGRFTWKIENFSEISKRELRSNVFDVGSYKWYILVYPQGCDVCNHLSLFLCVADYDKLLPGWSHFAQFTIAVVNKDPKKSKYSDTLHRFCKKEHDWGWKKFMELSKVLDGFTVQDTLVIKAQVQVILDKPNRPFKCLDAQYRRELVRVYLTNVESICRKFCDERRARLGWVREDPKKFKEFWDGLSSEQRKPLIKEKCDTILKGIVKQFFNEKEVTSTLVMDSLYSGCRQIEEYTRQWQQGKAMEGAPAVTINTEKNVFGFGCSLMEIIDRASKEYIPLYKDDKAQDALTLRSGQEGDDMRRDSVERDEKRLAELGRKTVEMYVISHVLCERLEIAYREAEALRRQELLIAEEEEAGRREETRLAAKAQADREKRAKKKVRKKQRKEQERIKKEAEEAEKSKAEADRRQEAERKQVEAQKKRLEEEEQQRSQQVHRAQQLAAATVVQPPPQQLRKKAPAAAPSPAASAHTPSANGVSSQAREQPSSTGRGAASNSSSRAVKPAAPEQSSLNLVTRTPSDGPSTSRIAHSSSSSSSSSSGSSSSSSDSTPDDSSSDSEDNAPAPSSKAQVSPSSGARAGMQASQQSGASSSQTGASMGKAAASGGQTRSVDELKSKVFILEERVRELEVSVRDKDTEILALRAQLSELNSSVELVELVKQASAANKAKDATEADTPTSTSSATPTAAPSGSAPYASTPSAGPSSSAPTVLPPPAQSYAQTLPQKLAQAAAAATSRPHVLTIRQPLSGSATVSAASSQEISNGHEGPAVSSTAAAAAAAHPMANGTSAAPAPLPANVPRHMHPAPHPSSISSDPSGPRPNAWGLPPRETPSPASAEQASLPPAATSDSPASLNPENFPPPSKDPPPSATSSHPVLQVNYSAAARGRAPPHPGAHVVAAVAAAAAASPTVHSPSAAPSFDQAAGAAPSHPPAPPQPPVPAPGPAPSRPPPPSSFAPSPQAPPRATSGQAVAAATGVHPLPHIRPIITHIPPSSTGTQQPSSTPQQQPHPTGTPQQQASPHHPQSSKQPPPPPQQPQHHHHSATSSQPQTPQQRSQPSSPGAANQPHPPPSPAAASAAADMASRGPSVVHVERTSSAPGSGSKPGPPAPPGPPPPHGTPIIPPPPASRPQTADKEASSNHQHMPAPAGPPSYLPTTSAPPTPIAANGIPPPPPPPLQPPVQDGPPSFRAPPGMSSASSNPHSLVNPRPPGPPMSPRSANAAREDGPVSAPPSAPRPMRHLNHGDGPFGTGYVPQPQAQRGRGLGFGSMAKRAAMPPSENQGLDDFQHMQMITDILGTD